MKINFDRVDNKTPFKVAPTNCLGGAPGKPGYPSIWFNPMLGIWKDSKAAATGFVFMQREVADAVVARLMVCVMHRWPESREYFQKIANTPFETAPTQEKANEISGEESERRRRKNGSKSGRHPARGSGVRLGSRQSRSTKRAEKRVKP